MRVQRSAGDTPNSVQMKNFYSSFVRLFYQINGFLVWLFCQINGFFVR